MPKDHPVDKVNEDAILEALGGDRKLLDEFRRFASKEKMREIRREIEYRVQELLENDFREENERAIEQMNVVYRKAWSKACADMGYEEAEFPSKY